MLKKNNIVVAELNFLYILAAKLRKKYVYLLTNSLT